MSARLAVSALCHAIGGLCMGYIVYIDDGEYLDWPTWLLCMGLVTVTTLICSRVLAVSRATLADRVLATATGGIVMAAVGTLAGWRELTAAGPALTTLTVLFLIGISQLYFLPSWISGLVPTGRSGGHSF